MNALIIGIRNDRSIAYAVAKELISNGVTVYYTYASDSKDEANYTMESIGVSAEMGFSLDVRKEEEIQECIKSILTKEKQIDYLFHSVAYGNHKVMCSSLPFSKEEPTKFIDIPKEDLFESLDISAYSLLAVVRASLPYLSSKASILTCTFNASQRVIPKYAGMAISKAFLEILVKYLAHELGSYGVRVNAISPGLLMTTSAAGITGVRTMRKASKKIAPLGATSYDAVAKAAGYYLSPSSEGVTGNIHYVDGGLNIMGAND